MKAGGTAFTIDDFKPAKPNKPAAGFMMSGWWVSDHSMLQTIEHGVEHQLEVIPGGGHDAKTFVPGLMKALQWFKEKLLK